MNLLLRAFHDVFMLINRVVDVSIVSMEKFFQVHWNNFSFSQKLLIFQKKGYKMKDCLSPLYLHTPLELFFFYLTPLSTAFEKVCGVICDHIFFFEVFSLVSGGLEILKFSSNYFLVQFKSAGRFSSSFPLCKLCYLANIRLKYLACFFC